MTSFQLAWLHLTRRKLSGAIAVISIGLAIASAGVLLKLYVLSQERFASLAHEGQSVVGPKSGGLEILLGCLNLEGDDHGFVPMRLYQSLRDKRQVQFEDGAKVDPTALQAVIPFLRAGEADGHRLIATSDDFLHRPKTEDSPTLQSGEWVHDGQPEVVLGSQAASDLARGVGDSVHVRLANAGVVMKVVGVLKPTRKSWDRGVYTSVASGQHLVGMSSLARQTIWGTDVLSYFLIYHPPEASAPLTSLVNERTVAQIISVDNEIRKLQELTGTGQGFGFLLMGLVLFLGGSCVATLMVARFEAMGVQVAVLRALGYTRGQISFWLAFEGLILGAGACVLGGVIDFCLFPWIKNLAGFGAVWSGPMIGSSVLVWLAALAASLLAVGVPMWRLTRQSLHQALKG